MQSVHGTIVGGLLDWAGVFQAPAQVDLLHEKLLNVWLLYAEGDAGVGGVVRQLCLEGIVIQQGPSRPHTLRQSGWPVPWLQSVLGHATHQERPLPTG